MTMSWASGTPGRSLVLAYADRQGLGDRMFHIVAALKLATLSSEPGDRATVWLPPPCMMLHAKHNKGKEPCCNRTWDDYITLAADAPPGIQMRTMRTQDAWTFIQSGAGDPRRGGSTLDSSGTRKAVAGCSLCCQNASLLELMRGPQACAVLVGEPHILDTLSVSLAVLGVERHRFASVELPHRYSISQRRVFDPRASLLLLGTPWQRTLADAVAARYEPFHALHWRRGDRTAPWAFCNSPEGAADTMVRAAAAHALARQAAAGRHDGQLAGARVQHVLLGTNEDSSEAVAALRAALWIRSNQTLRLVPLQEEPELQHAPDNYVSYAIESFLMQHPRASQVFVASYPGDHSFDVDHAVEVGNVTTTYLCAQGWPKVRDSAPVGIRTGVRWNGTVPGHDEQPDRAKAVCQTMAACATAGLSVDCTTRWGKKTNYICADTLFPTNDTLYREREACRGWIGYLFALRGGPEVS